MITIFVPLFKKASSLILFWIIVRLNFTEENISFDGKNFIRVPVFFDFPIPLKGFIALPFLNSTKYFFPSLSIINSNFSESAFTTETPTPCNPPETLYESWSNLPPECNWVIITSAADFFSPLWISTGIPLPSSFTVIVPSWLISISIFWQYPARASSIELSTTS